MDEWNQICLCEFHLENLNSSKTSASLAHADWANVVDLIAFLKIL